MELCQPEAKRAAGECRRRNRFIAHSCHVRRPIDEACLREGAIKRLRLRLLFRQVAWRVESTFTRQIFCNIRAIRSFPGSCSPLRTLALTPLHIVPAIPRTVRSLRQGQREVNWRWRSWRRSAKAMNFEAAMYLYPSTPFRQLLQGLDSSLSNLPRYVNQLTS